MSLVTTDEVIAQVSPGVDEPTLQSVIDMNEAWLARRVGPLDGEFVQSLSPVGASQRLLRPTDEVVVAGVDAQYLSLSWDGYVVTIADGHFWPLGTLTFTYTPNDVLEVKQAVIDLCRITLTNSPYQSESADVHNYSRSATPSALRDAIVHALLHGGSSQPMTATVSFA